MGYGERCQACGAVAPTRYVDFKQNIGMLVVRRHKTVAGNLCKPCVHHHFWSMTGTTLAVGWLGQISLFIAPIFVINNVIRYVAVLGMPSPGSKPAGGSPPRLPPRLPAAAAPLVPRLADSGPLPFDDGSEEATPVEVLPEVTPAELLQPHWAPMVARIKAKEPLAVVAADVAAETGLTPDEVSQYVIDRVNRAKAAKAAQQSTAATAR